MENKIKIIATTAALLVLTQASHAANINWTGGGVTDDWNDTANWGGSNPGAILGDQALFNTGDSNTPTADFVFANANDLTTRNGALITIGANVDISGFDDWRFGANSANGGGSLTMTGGSLSGAAFVIASSTSATSRSVLTASGGSLTTTGAFSIGTLGDFNLTGDAASFDVGSFTVNDGSVFNATFDATGISTVVSTGAFTIGTTSAALNLDFSAFSGTGVFDLVSFGTISGAYDSGSITGLGALSGGRTATLGYDADSIFVNIAVPEPSTYALLAGLTGLACVMVRRRRA